MNSGAFILTAIVFAASGLATITVIVAGFAVMLGQRQWLKRLLSLAALFIAIAVFGPNWLPGDQVVTGTLPEESQLVLPEWTMIWFVLASTAAFIFRARRLALGLAALPALRWIVFPVLISLNIEIPLWLMPLVEVIVCLLMLQALLSIVFGRDVAASVIAGLLLRSIDSLSRGPIRRLHAAWRSLFE